MPLVGYNDNIEHCGQTFHVQTEDSGARRPHVITHLFADGGRIVTTTKTSYADQVGAEDVADRVKSLMVAQHKAMLDALRTGEFDHLLELPEGAPAAPAPAPSAPEQPVPEPTAAEAPPQATPSGSGLGPDLPDLVSAAAAATELELPADARPPRQEQPTPPVPVAALGDRPPPPRPVPGQPPGPPPPPPLPKPPRPRRKRAPTTEPEVLPPPDAAVPVDDLERAAAEADEDFLREIRPGAETDAAARSRKPTPIRAGTYSYIAGGQRPPAPPPARSIARPAPPAAPPRKRRYPQTSPGRRRASSRSGEARGDGEERSAPPFGARFLTERRLDEVVLEFLERHHDP